MTFTGNYFIYSRQIMQHSAWIPLSLMTLNGAAYAECRVIVIVVLLSVILAEHSKSCYCSNVTKSKHETRYGERETKGLGLVTLLVILSTH